MPEFSDIELELHKLKALAEAMPARQYPQLPTPSPTEPGAYYRALMETAHVQRAILDHYDRYVAGSYPRPLILR